MIWKPTRAATALVAAMNLIGGPLAGGDEYVFQTVKPGIKSSTVAPVAVRLLHKPTGKPVVDATIVQMRLDMAPDGMADMATAIVPLPSPEPGVFAFKAPLTMTGRWQLTISAKVQGEPETVSGKLTFKVNR